ncbi:sugar phosphate isomerase/epimerase [Tissierellaceae bacterium BX21]|uniref:Sugar phosphate isomerase/epimerase n=1 Tax=Paratissierella segnis TaxID=2763679 RepID=A0A926IIW0_9FIRM|nr:sugar phosphate isomerase/epimerase [Paratissierella segnis]
MKILLLVIGIYLFQLLTKKSIIYTVYTKYFTGSKLSEYSYNYQVPLIVEATNRYETSLANTVEEAVELIKGLDSPYLRVLPDTYHMNIEEINFSETLFKYFNYFDSLHLSDNNRFYPGYGSIDFYSLFRFLKCLNYKGTFAIEGNIKNNFESDLKVSLDMIKSIVSRL